MRPSPRFFSRALPAVLFLAGALAGWKLQSGGDSAAAREASPPGGPGRNRSVARLRSAQDGPLASLGTGAAAGDAHRVALELIKADAGSIAGFFEILDRRAPTPLDRLLWLSLAWQRWLELDTPAAMLALHGRNDLAGDDIDDFVKEAAESAGNDALAMLRASAALPASARRTRWIALCAEAAQEKQSLPLASVLASLPDDPPDLRLTVEGSHWLKQAEKDPEAAAAWAAAHPEREEARVLAVRVFQAKAEADPSAALASAQEIASPLLRLQAARTVMEKWIERDATAALAAAQALPPSALRSFSLGRAAREIAATDPDRALALLPQITSRSDRLRVWDDIAGGLFLKDPVRALDVLDRDIPREAVADAGAELIDHYGKQAWETKGPSLSAPVHERVRQLAAGDPALAQRLANSWASHQPAEAFAWAAQLPANAGAGALDTAAAELARKDRDLAAARISTISDPQRRAVALAAALRTVDGDSRAWSSQFPSDDLLRARRILRHGSAALSQMTP